MSIEQGRAESTYGKDSWKEEELLRDSQILENTRSFIVEYNLKTKQCYIDPAQRQHVYGDWSKRLAGAGFRHVVLNEDVPVLEKFFNFSNLKVGDSRRMDARFYVKKHSYEWFRVSLVCYGDVHGQKERVLITFTNAEQELETIRRMKFLLAKDPLTHLPNLDSFIQMTGELLQSNSGKRYAFIRMDVNKFRIINEIYGTKEGDNILRYIGVKIQEWVGPGQGECTCCRVSSDMFCVCIEYNEEDIRELVQFMQTSLKGYPIKFEMVMSFGIYVTHEEDLASHTPVLTLMDRAVVAQQTVKSSYLSHVAYYDEKIQKREAAEKEIISEMRHALGSEQFHVYLQPKCEMGTGKIMGAEALVRWVHPEKGLVSPGAFVPIFEKNGFISELDAFILRATCKIIRRWLDEKKEVYPISVNVSRADLYNPNLLSQIKDCVDEYQVPHELIAFELTESAFILDNRQLYNLASLLRENQFQVLMDDFGSGYSSLNVLREMPVDVLKIDLKFLPPSSDDVRGNIILKCVVDMARQLGMDVVVEGVETAEHVKFLLSIGCKCAQGFYYYKPMSLSDYEQALAQGK